MTVNGSCNHTPWSLNVVIVSHNQGNIVIISCNQRDMAIISCDHLNIVITSYKQDKYVLFPNCNNTCSHIQQILSSY